MLSGPKDPVELPLGFAAGLLDFARNDVGVRCGCMQTDLLATSTAAQRKKAVTRAVELLRKGEVVALPTETVYGLAAHALNPVAVAKIFEAKERPRFDPLIVHLPEKQWLHRVATIDDRSRAQIEKLISQFWPGPLTLVLDRQPIVPDIVTAGLDTVAVRMSSHPIFAEIISAFGKPLAAPSANRFGRVSPTTAQHVVEELGGRIPLIVDAGPTTHGIESTIICVHGDKIEILRRGPVMEEELRGAGFHPASAIGLQPIDPFKEIRKWRGRHLPHWTQEGATYAVTFRLADALPAGVVADWELQRHEILERARRQGRELTEAEERRLAELFSEKVESCLDGGHGKCWLHDERVARVVRDALLHFEGERYDLAAWCVMPNHVHVIVHPLPGHRLSEILHGWKSFTAKKANQLLGRSGEFWQPESYDQRIRSERELRYQVQYVLENPQKAGLKGWPWVGAAADWKPAPGRQDAGAAVVRAPGQLPSHYAPATPLRVIDDASAFTPRPGERVGLLGWKTCGEAQRFAAVRCLSPRQDLCEAAANLFRYLRELDALGLDLIVAECLPKLGLGAAIMDRLQRASHP
jgi:tRNA threonylcarbamoyl adenosine modification protein (Sua5/YciO/YrdC/YwlC family)